MSTSPRRPRPHCVLPIKAFDRAKSRLAETLAHHARAALARRLFEHVLDAVADTPAIARVLVATDGDDVARLCAQRGIDVTFDRPAARGSLAAVVDAALERCAQSGAAEALVLMGDLPHVSAGDLSRLLAAPTAADVVLVPDRRGRGCNALRLPLARGFHTHFGHPDSGRLHRLEAARLGLSLAVIECDGIALDLDLPGELAAAASVYRAAGGDSDRHEGARITRPLSRAG